MSHTERIAIVGAGIAGLSLAILARKQGYQVSVYEQNNQIAALGTGITLWPNAMFVLTQMGLEKEIIGLGGMPEAMCQYSQNGTLQSRLDIKPLNDMSGFPTITILRRDLMRILVRAAESSAVDVHLNCTISTSDIEPLKQKYDLVVGADGRMNSVARQLLYSDQISPCYQGFINIIGISQLQKNELNNTIYDFRGEGERFGIVPVTSDLCCWAAAWAADQDKASPLSDWYNEMKQRFCDWHNRVQTVLAAHDPASRRCVFVHDIEPLPYWHKDNLLIIGDAAHGSLPTSGQGACQALEDAWHLYRLLISCTEQDGTSLQNNVRSERILHDFYQCRIAKTSAAQAIGRQVARGIFNLDENNPDIKHQATVSAISAEQLSRFWMQGLEV